MPSTRLPISRQNNDCQAPRRSNILLCSSSIESLDTRSHDNWTVLRLHRFLDLQISRSRAPFRVSPPSMPAARGAREKSRVVGTRKSSRIQQANSHDPRHVDRGQPVTLGIDEVRTRWMNGEADTESDVPERQCSNPSVSATMMQLNLVCSRGHTT